MKEILLIRHTTPEIDSNTCYGISDINVNGSFKSEYTKIIAAIDDFDPECVFSSPLIRCKKLAQTIYPDKAITIDNRLMEMNMGEWEMKNWSTIEKSAIEHWSTDFVHISPPNGECFNDLYERTVNFWDDIINSKTVQKKAAIITHSGVIRCLLSRYLAIPLNKIFQLKINFGAVIKLTLHSNFEEVEIIKP
jgi:alpha-ribazole phosphatase